MTIRCVEVSPLLLDKSKSHVRVEREPSGHLAVVGAIGHPDVIDMTHIPPRSFRSREQAVQSAIEVAEKFGLEEILLVQPV